MISCWHCSTLKPPDGPCRRCGKRPEQRFDLPIYRSINRWLSKLAEGNSAPVDALMEMPEDNLGINLRLDTIDATVDLVIGIQVKRRKKKERPKLVLPS